LGNAPKDGHEAVAVCWLQQLQRFVNDNIFYQITRLLHQFYVEAHVSRLVIAASPFGFHLLQEILGNFQLQLRLPFLDQYGHNWPSDEVEAINAARIAGKTDEEIRTLVAKLEAARKDAN
jgi:hypothetical protein